MENISIKGKITNILEAKEGVKDGKAWKVQAFVLETEEQYPKHMCFEVFGQEKLDLMNITQGKTYEVFINIDAREYQGRWYNSIRAWKVTEAEADVKAENQPVAAITPQPTQEAIQQAEKALEDTSSDLPF